MAIPEEKYRGGPKADAKREAQEQKRYIQGNIAQSRVRLGVAQTMDKLYPLQSQ